MINTEFIAYLGLVFVAAAGAVLGIGLMVNRGSALRGRLGHVGGPSGSAGQPGQSEWRARVVKVATPMAKLATPTDEKDVSRLRAKFLNAGLRRPTDPVIFFAAKAILAIGLPILLVWVAGGAVFKLKGYMPYAAILAVAALGYYLPNVILSGVTQRRQRELFEAFPDALDLIIVCVESGLSLDMAIARAGAEMKLRSPVLAEELALVSTELRIGATRERALRNLGTRTGVEEIQSFVAMMLQADRFGTSIANSLRVQADALRVRRRQRAEEMAAKLPLKLLFPLIFCIFPSLLLVLMGPAMIRIYRILLPTMTGG